VPLVIDVVAEDQIAAGAVHSMQSLIARVPGLYFESTWGGQNAAPTIRGQQASPAGDVNVGVFVDGVYQANPTALDPGRLDFERIEVVRGPQNTLYGHSTFAGAIHYVSRMPTETPTAGFALDAGSDGLWGGAGFVSGSLVENRLLGRLALGASTFDGTQVNDAASNHFLGGWQKASAALTLAAPVVDERGGKLAVRYHRTVLAQPAVSTLTYGYYDCGGIEAASGAWSYFCGRAPARATFELSPGVPDSRNEILQAVLDYSWPVGGGRIESRTSGYRGVTDGYRDFDASGAGETFGVCSENINCSGPAGIPRAVNRLTSANEVSRGLTAVREWGQEVRWLREVSDKLGWMVGATAWWTNVVEEGRFGAEQGDLGVDERLTAVLPQSPYDVGPLSIANNAIVPDPNHAQVLRSRNTVDRQTIAVFGSIDYRISSSVRSRVELRATRERRGLDNQLANFRPGFGDTISSQDFDDVTPRLSFQYEPSDSWRAYFSAAKGSQSGGINPVPGLLPSEQAYKPESNWTYELSSRYTSAGGGFDVRATAYYIDWTDMQLLGFPDSPGVVSLITRNTAGLFTRGLEISLDAAPASWVRTEIDLSYSDARFRAGSDDPGSRRFCGLSGANSTSTFCTIGPAREGSVAGQVLVPYIDGNRPPRSPRKMWHLGVILVTPPLRGNHPVVFRIDANGQDDVFDRAVDGLHFGARTLLDARIDYDIGKWSLTLWGRNLGNVQYVRALSSRGQVFYPTSPRPFDMIYGDGRRFGLSVAFKHGSTS